MTRSILMGFAVVFGGGCRSADPIAAQTAASRTWTVVVGDGPPIRFSFPPPQESYAGQFTKANGRLTLGADLSLSGASGRFVVSIFDLTMGDPDLDQNVRNNIEMFAGGTFPVSSFTLRRIETDVDRLAWNQRTPVTLHGDFELKGVSVSLSAPAWIELQRDGTGTRVLLAGSFAIDRLREAYNIAGPGGEDDPAGNRVNVEFSFVLAPITP